VFALHLLDQRADRVVAGRHTASVGDIEVLCIDPREFCGPVLRIRVVPDFEVQIDQLLRGLHVIGGDAHVCYLL
jgi:hypothetical protein